MNPLVVYHGGCRDGFTAATLWHMLAWLLGSTPERWDERFVYGSYGGFVMPELDKTDDVVFVDFSMGREELIETAGRVNTVTVLDHHATAIKNLVDMPANVNCVLDNSRSGAMITWDFLMPGATPPVLVKYVQDADLWRWELPHGKEFAAWLSTVDYTFDGFKEAIQRAELDFDGIVVEGSAVWAKEQKLMIEAASEARLVDGIPYCAAPYSLGSETANLLLDMYSNAPYAGYYTRRKNGTFQFGLRSRDETVDVSLIAEQYGGGGHKTAAGFIVDKTHELVNKL